MPFIQPWFEVDFGSAYGGLATVGYRLYKNDGTDSVARTITGVVDLSGDGSYGIPSVNVPDNAVGIQWDTGGGSPVYANEDIEPYRNNKEYELWSSMADDQTDAKMGFWIERDGQRKTDVTSMTAIIRKCSDGSVVHAFPPNISPDARGVFYFETPVAVFPYHDPLYADVEATDGVTTWYNNFGITRV